MTKIAKNKPQHRIREIFDELVGHTPTLKKSFSHIYNMPIRKVHRYYSGDAITLKHQDALDFLQFFNANRHPESDVYTLEQLYFVSHQDNVIAHLNLR